MSEQSPSKGHAVNKIFGDSLPETTTDEWDEHPGDGEAARDAWLRENKPPHHG